VTPPGKVRLSRALKISLGVKIAVLIAIWALLDSGFRLGDVPLSAAERNPSAETAATTGEKAPPSDNADGKGQTRKSFLSNLLELPKLDPDTVKKDELGRYLEIAERKKHQIDDRLDLLKHREEQLKGLEGSIDEKLRKLDDERRYFAQTIQKEKDLKGERLDKLVTLYAKMDPKKAAPVMEKLDKDLVVALFKVMPQKQITAILEAMNPDKSVAISEYYGRVRSMREYDTLKEMNKSLLKEFDDCKGMPQATAQATNPAAQTADERTDVKP